MIFIFRNPVTAKLDKLDFIQLSNQYGGQRVTAGERTPSMFITFISNRPFIPVCHWAGSLGSMCAAGSQNRDRMWIHKTVCRKSPQEDRKQGGGAMRRLTVVPLIGSGCHKSNRCRTDDHRGQRGATGG